MELQITVLADATKTDDVLVVRFQLENEPPHRLAYVKYSGIDHAEVTDQYVDFVATRAASNDKHVWVEAQNPVVQESSDPVEQTVEELRKENYHFRKVEVLPDVSALLAQ